MPVPGRYLHTHHCPPLAASPARASLRGILSRCLCQADAAISQRKFAAAARLLTRAIEEIREADKESARQVKFDAELEADVLFKRSQCYSQLDSTTCLEPGRATPSALTPRARKLT